MFTLTVTPSIGTARTCAAQAGSARVRRAGASVTRGSALETTLGAADPLARLELDALARHDARDRHARRHDDARLARDVAQQERHHPHAALARSPRCRAGPPSARRRGGNRIEAVPGVVRAGVGADHPLAEIGELQPLVVEVALDHLDHRPLEEQRRAPRRRRPGGARCASRVGDGPIQTSPVAVRPERVAEPVASPPSSPASRRTSPGAKRRISSSQRSSSSQSWTLLPSSNGTNIPPSAGVQRKPWPAQVELAHHQRDAAGRRRRRRATCARRATAPPACTRRRPASRASSTSTRCPARAR